jgi:hypothetical protein
MTPPACSRRPPIIPHTLRRRAHPPRRSSLFVATLSAVACSTSTAPAACDAPSVGAVTISAGTSPDISWAAPCNAEALDVFHAVTGTAVWQLRAASKGIPKPVAYDVVPAGVTEEHPAEALHAGTTYGVLITIVTLDGSRLQSVGDFTP